MIPTIQIAMAITMFVLGLCSCVAGMVTILSHRYQQALHSISAHSARITAKALADVALAPLVEAVSGLVGAIDQLIRTSAGVGAFLCLTGVVLCAVGFWMLSGL